MASIKQWKINGTTYNIKATYDSSGRTISSSYVQKAGDTMTGQLKLNHRLVGTNDYLYGTTLPGSPVEGQIFFQINDTIIDFPTGGTTGQILRKKSNANYDWEWSNDINGNADTLDGYHYTAFPSTTGTRASGTWGINISGTANVAKGIYTTSANGDNITALKSVWDSLPVNQTLGVYLAHGSASFFYGWRLSGYPLANAYGGGICDNYGSPDYINISNGSFISKHIWLAGDAVTSAVWNDYAEYREVDTLEPGRCVYEKGDDTLAITTQRLMRGCEITSDTWGFAEGKTDKAQTPIAVAGRVLAYPFENRNLFKPGYFVCSGPNGTVSIMSDQEAKEYPWAIVGSVSCVPDYEEWGGGKNADRNSVKVNGRIWIKVK